jgi:DNA-binding response OmpR family regulator
VSRDAIFVELSKLRERVEVLEDENRTLREAMAVEPAFPVEWRLTRLQRRTLAALLDARGEYVHRDRIMVRLYGPHWDTNPKILDVVVCRLRRILAPTPAKILTQVGFGYRLTAEAVAYLTDLLKGGEPAPLAA